MDKKKYEVSKYGVKVPVLYFIREAAEDPPGIRVLAVTEHTDDEALGVIFNSPGPAEIGTDWSDLLVNLKERALERRGSNCVVVSQHPDDSFLDPESPK